MTILALMLALAGAPAEVPAAVEIVSDLATEVDFFSIGTNDLIQYSLVVDREDPRLSSPHHAFHPAILRMIQRVTATAHAAAKVVCVCGEIAAQVKVGRVASYKNMESGTQPAIHNVT